MRTTKTASVAALSLACILALGTTSSARAESAWILALPPVKALNPSQDGDAHRTPAEIVTAMVDRMAPITDWRQGPTFPRGSACEDVRLRHVQEFHNAIEAIGETTLSDVARARLAGMAQEAFSRCVPAFAFSANSQD